jgi:SAM-dependent methyltransferase
MARRFPALQLVGIEFEPDSVARARANVVAAGLADRVEVRHGDVSELAGAAADFDLAYFQYALHQLHDPAGALRTAWTALRPGGRLLVLDWTLPSTLDEFRTRQGELIAGVQLDELYQGTSLASREAVASWFEVAELPAPTVIDLPSGATLFLIERA